MLTKTKIAFAAALILGTASAALADQDDRKGFAQASCATDFDLVLWLSFIAGGKGIAA